MNDGLLSRSVRLLGLRGLGGLVTGVLHASSVPMRLAEKGQIGPDGP